MPDSIYIRDLKLPVVIGTNPSERLAPQEIIVNIELNCDLSKAGLSDELEDTVDYFALYEMIVKLAETSSFFLLERLAASIADRCLATEGVRGVTVTLEKTSVLPLARAAAIRITRTR